MSDELRAENERLKERLEYVETMIQELIQFEPDRIASDVSGWSYQVDEVFYDEEGRIATIMGTASNYDEAGRLWAQHPYIIGEV